MLTHGGVRHGGSPPPAGGVVIEPVLVGGMVVIDPVGSGCVGIPVVEPSVVVSVESPSSPAQPNGTRATRSEMEERVSGKCFFMNRAHSSVVG